ncbi:MAG: hypothetical protein ACD_80C00013G0010 [uncultured bacterium (gcode 4)]|uniref:Uncharacterized protein n=1 Tax=uncultured bacterium (gcode 4) TaxID=1234023 RepID=K1X5T0_9BACT|nr:MAG: hypothetical protein ACD_80C00013G0010 [uncultured bacterium (gcode 4)]
MKQKNMRNTITQFALPFFTIISFAAISLKLPQRWVILNLLAQPFWLYSSWKGYKQAGQIGMFINTVIITLILIWGIVNYWVL